jgi:hypothetical protein
VKEAKLPQLSAADGGVHVTPFEQVIAPGPVKTVIAAGQLLIEGLV